MRSRMTRMHTSYTSRRASDDSPLADRNGALSSSPANPARTMSVHPRHATATRPRAVSSPRLTRQDGVGEDPEEALELGPLPGVAVQLMPDPEQARARGLVWRLEDQAVHPPERLDHRLLARGQHLEVAPERLTQGRPRISERLPKHLVPVRRPIPGADGGPPADDPSRSLSPRTASGGPRRSPRISRCRRTGSGC
jgi:hypothetical protein